MNPAAPVTSALRSGNNRLDRVDGAAERSQDRGSLYRRLNGFANARDAHPVRRPGRDSSTSSRRRGLRRRHPSVDDPRCVGLLLVLTVIRRHLFNHFQRRVVAVWFQNDDLVRKAERLTDDICRIVVMMQNGLNQDQIENLSSNRS